MIYDCDSENRQNTAYLQYVQALFQRLTLFVIVLQRCQAACTAKKVHVIVVAILTTRVSGVVCRLKFKASGKWPSPLEASS